MALTEQIDIITEFTQRLQVAVIGAEETTDKHEKWVEGAETETIPTANGPLKTLRGQIAEWRLTSDSSVQQLIDSYSLTFEQKMDQFDDDFVNYLLTIGFEPAVLYGPEILLERRAQTVAFNGVTYYWGGTLPHTTTGDFGSETNWLIAPIVGGVEIPQMSFASGGNIVRKTQSVLGADGEWYYWAGTFPKLIAPGSTVESAGGVGQNKFKLSSGVVPLRPLMKIVAASAGLILNSGSFEFGATISSETDALPHFSTGKLWRWGGVLPKVVDVGSEPLSSGGVGPSQWIEVSTAIGTNSGISISELPPMGVGLGHRWYCTTDGRTYIRYLDSDSVQWVEESPQASVFDGMEPRVKEAVRRSYAEAGLTLVSGSFDLGGTVYSKTEVLLNESDGIAYGWGGNYPKQVGGGSTPATTGGIGAGLWIPKSGELLRDELFNVSVPLDSYEHLVVDGDWTVALNTALATGRQVAPNPSRVYSFSGVVQSQGNQIVGKFNVTPTRPELSSLGTFTFDSSTQSHVGGNIKLLYCLRTYDLIELLYIRSMGFNMVFHGGDMQSERPGVDTVSALNLMLDNALTANLRVNMTTGHILVEDSMAIGYVTAFHEHPAVWGFSVFDEPTFNGVSVARQTERLEALRVITSKNLNCTDVIQNYTDYRSGYNPWAHGYDLFFVDSYSHNVGGSQQEKIDNDINDMRTAIGVAAVHCPEAKVVPMCGLFKHIGFSLDSTQIKATSSVFVKSSGGDFAVFSWDAVEVGLISNILTDSDLRGFAKSLCEIVINGNRTPKAYRIGGSSSNPASVPPVAVKDGVELLRTRDYTTAFLGSGTAFGVLKSGVDSEFTSPLVDGSIGGLFFRGQYPIAVTNIELKRHLSVDMLFFDVTGSKSGSLSVHYTGDEGGSASDPSVTFPFVFSPSGSSLITKFNILTGDFWRGYKLVFAMSVNPVVDAINYRSGLCGFIITSEW